MSKQTVRRPAAKRRPQARKGRTAVAAGKGGRKTDRTSWIIAGVVIAIGVALVVAFAGGAKKVTASDSPAPASLVKKVTSVPASVFNQVGAGTAAPLPKRLQPAEALLTKDGKPSIVYIGAEYCPYCATERWPMVVALSRFGTFKNLRVSHSSANDVFPNTETFSFHGATYTSKYIAFDGTETHTNIQEGSGYKTLDTPSTANQALLNKFDAPPYVDPSSKGAIPFLDFANQYLISGSTYKPNVLQGKSAGVIADSLHDSKSDISQGAVGVANSFTAAICTLTKSQPANVCSDPAIKSIQAQIG